MSNRLLLSLLTLERICFLSLSSSFHLEAPPPGATQNPIPTPKAPEPEVDELTKYWRDYVGNVPFHSFSSQSSRN